MKALPRGETAHGPSYKQAREGISRFGFIAGFRFAYLSHAAQTAFDAIPGQSIRFRYRNEKVGESAASWRSTSTAARVTKNQGGATCAGAWSNFIRPTLWSASFSIHFCEDGHSRRPVASPPSSRPPCSPHRPSPVSMSSAASRRRASPDRSPTMARRTPERIPAPPRAPEAPFVRSSNQPRRCAHAPSRASPSRSRNFPGSIRIWRSSAHFSPQRAQGETCAPTQSSCHVCYGRRRRQLMS